MSQPRYVEFFRLKALVEEHMRTFLVDGNDDYDNEYFDGGTPNG